jgi:DNA-binding NarL/FixJ family response regulator
VLILASTADWSVMPAMAAGAAGYLLKDSQPEAIRSAVVSAHLGGQVLCREAARWLIQDTPDYRLTRRETDVLRLVSQGADNKEIAELLQLGEKTVRNYVSRLYHKLAVHNRAQISPHVLDDNSVPTFDDDRAQAGATGGDWRGNSQ